MFVNDIFKKKQITEANVKKPQPYNEPGWTRKLSKQELDALAGYNEKSIKDIKKEKQDKKQDVKEAGPFSYGAKKPRKGSVADLAAQKRQEQERGRQPIEPRDQMVGTARVTKDVAEGSEDDIEDTRQFRNAVALAKSQKAIRQAKDGKNAKYYADGTKVTPDEVARRAAERKAKKQGVAEGRGNIEALRTELMGEYLNIYYNALDGWNMTDHIINLQDVYGRVKRSRDPVLQQTYNLLMDHAEESIDVQASAALKAIRILGDEPNYTPPPRPPMSPEDSARADAFVNQFLAALVSHGIKTHPDWQKNNDKGVAEGSAQDRLHKRHQELRKKSGLPDPNYYKELKATYDLPDAERYAKQKELKQKYKVTNEELTAPTADQTNTDDLDQLSTQMRTTVPKTRVDTTKWTDEQRFLQDKKVGKFLGSSFDEWKQQQKRTTQSAMPTNEDRERYIEELQRAGYEIVTERRMTCPECGGVAYEDKMLAEKQDACYHKVKSRYKVWPSAYASGALVRCRKKGAKNWGNKSK